MKIKRPFLILLMILLTFGVISGCSSPQGSPSASPASSPTESPSPTDTGSSQPSITVDIFQYQQEFNDGLLEAAKEFTKANKDVKVTIQTVAQGQDYHAALRAKFNSGVAPAVFNIMNPKDLEEWKPKLLELSRMEAVKNVMEGFLAGVTQEGKIYGIPYYMEGYGLIYNKKIIEEAQIDVKEIDSFKALAEMFKELDKKKKELKIDAVFALPAKETESTGVYLSNIFISPEFDHDVFKTYQAKTLEFKHAEAFKQMLDIQNQYSVQPSVDMDYKTQVEKLFAAGKVALIQQGNWIYESIEIVDKELASTGIGFLPYPASELEGDSNPVGVPLYWAFNNSKPEEVQKTAKDFINWLYLSEAGKKVVTENLKFVPAIKGFASDTVKDPLGKDILNQASSSKTINWVFRAYPPGWADKLGSDIKLYLENKLTWDQVVKNAKTSWADARK